MGFFKKKNGERMFDSGDTVSVIGAEAYFQGTLNAKGSLRIDGRLEGTINDAHAVIIGRTGRVTGDISGDSVAISGEVRGNICAESAAELLSTAKVTGDIRTAKILIEEGAFFDGRCNMIKPGEEAAPLVDEDEARAEGV